MRYSTFKVLLIVDSAFLWRTASCRVKNLLKTLDIKHLVQVLLLLLTMGTWRTGRQRLQEEEMKCPRDFTNIAETHHVVQVGSVRFT